MLRRIYKLLIILGVFIPLSLSAQDKTETGTNQSNTDQQKMQQTNVNQDYSKGQIAADLSNQLKTKLNLSNDQREEVAEAVSNYIENSNESHKELKNEKGDKEDVMDVEADLANERVELSSTVADNLNDQQKSQWQSIKTDWWLTLDNQIFNMRNPGAQLGTTQYSRGNTNNNMNNSNENSNNNNMNNSNNNNNMNNSDNDNQ